MEFKLNCGLILTHQAALLCRWAGVLFLCNVKQFDSINYFTCQGRLQLFSMFTECKLVLELPSTVL